MLDLFNLAGFLCLTKWLGGLGRGSFMIELKQGWYGRYAKLIKGELYHRIFTAQIIRF